MRRSLHLTKAWLTFFASGFALFVATHTVVAQEADTVTYPVWEADLAAKLNASQASYHNWTEGGINALAATGIVTGDFVRKSAEWTQTYESRLSVGLVKQGDLNLRKSEDVIRLRATINYVGNGFLKKYTPTVSAGIRTQFAPGFNFDKNPFPGDDRLPPVQVSNFFSPATITQSAGLEYASDWGFKQRLGVGAKETIVLIHKFRELYGLAPTEAVRFQLGVESYTEVDREVFKNVKFKSSLGLFAAFNQEELPDMLWENVVVMQVNKWLSADFQFVSMFDRDVSDEIQVREALSIGVSLIFI